MIDRSPLNKVLRQARAWIARRGKVRQVSRGVRRGSTTLVVILDGTMSSLEPGTETNAGLIYRLLAERTPARDLALYYEPGIQYTNWRQLRDVIEGRGLNRQIRRAYGWLASHYRPGDRIYLFGYSRGAYAVRSLAGVIDRLGLLKAEAATERNVHMAYRYYRTLPDSAGARDFRRLYCHDSVDIEMIGAFDTVKALGMRGPILWRYSQMAHRFHDHALGPSLKRGYHALARDETRVAYAPVMWRLREDWVGTCEQVWFPGTHGDVGGQLAGVGAARSLSNIPLVWMLDRAEAAGLDLPEGWRRRYPIDLQAPSIGLNRGLGRLLRYRTPRAIGIDASERTFDPTGDLPNSRTAAVSRRAVS
ncbi:DUF2235 domain-containing protein [Palleronia abyssalis]|uniref:T6SS Phospholipase effector Tle1-like catalytic domain-containing protein n=1 Tax=Palleronia abyssalis TaxID=1501240 RepID=A0A2R8BUI0_9RHOB|nr:DUF2235 domain-containing protein [Palleronia abyssalis]SPJ23785.1 hypothetical protein PAA8504_01600 [Palleronia abyssalis]